MTKDVPATTKDSTTDLCQVPVTRRLRADDPFETKREPCGSAFPCAQHGAKDATDALAKRVGK